MFQEADNPFLGYLREERPNVGVQYEVHLPAADPDYQCIQRIVLAASRSEPIREPEEVFLVDHAQHCGHGSLDDLVFECGDRERAFAAVFLRNVAPAGRLRPVRSCLDPCVQVLDTMIEALFVGLPRHAVDAGSRVTLQRVERCSQHLGIDVVQKRGEPFLLPSPRGEPYAFQRL